LRTSAFSSTARPKRIPSGRRECHRSAVAAWKGARGADRRQNGLKPANCSAPASLRGRDIFGSSHGFEARSGESVFVACRLIHFADCLVAGLSGGQCIHTCIQAVVGNSAAASARSKSELIIRASRHCGDRDGSHPDASGAAASARRARRIRGVCRDHGTETSLPNVSQ